MNCAVLDIETTSLSAVGHGWILCAVVKPLKKSPVVFRYDELRCPLGKEKTLIASLLEELSSYQLWIGHNIINFDFPFVKSRASQLRIQSVPAKFVYDTMTAFRRTKYRTSMNVVGKPTCRLEHVADFFGLPNKKTRILPMEQAMALWESGEKRKKSMDFIVQHCIDDTIMTEEIYWKLIECDNVWGIRRIT